MKVVVAGGTGSIGGLLIEKLKASDSQIVVLTRREKFSLPDHPGLTAQKWDGCTQGDWAKCLEGADAVINLCGEGIAHKRWSPAQKKLLRSSRIEPTLALVEAINLAQVKPKVLINISAVGYYGNVPERIVDENFPQGIGFLADLCADWEAAAKKVDTSKVRLVLPRLGIVLARGQGALKKIIPPFHFFLGGPLGSGKQWFPWVHIEDVVNLILEAVQNSAITGPLNVCSPQPVRMNLFCKNLGRVLHRPSWLPVPRWILQLILGEMSEILLGGQCAIPQKAIEKKYLFSHPNCHSALSELFSKL